MKIFDLKKNKSLTQIYFNKSNIGNNDTDDIMRIISNTNIGIIKPEKRKKRAHRAGGINDGKHDEGTETGRDESCIWRFGSDRPLSGDVGPDYKGWHGQQR